MIPGMNPKAMEQAMKKMGIKQEDIPSTEVIIKAEGRDIVITNPKVVKVNMMGQDSFQITGTVQEQTPATEISEDDIKTVSTQAGVPETQAKEALENANGDLAAAIMQLKK